MTQIRQCPVCRQYGLLSNMEFAETKKPTKDMAGRTTDEGIEAIHLICLKRIEMQELSPGK